jgi:hypothetical protein
LTLRPFRSPTPVNRSDWGGKDCSEQFHTHKTCNKSSCSFKKASFSYPKAVPIPQFGRLASPGSSELRARSNQGSLPVLPQQASLGTGLPFFGNTSFERPGGFPLGSRQRAPPKGRNRASTGQSGVLFTPFHRSKEGRVVTSSYKSKTPTQIYFSAQVSDGFGLHRGSHDPRRRLGHVNRSKGCIFPRPHSSPAQKIPPFHLERQILPVRVMPVRPFDSAEHFHARDASRRTLVQDPSNESRLLFGRHTHSCGLTP